MTWIFAALIFAALAAPIFGATRGESRRRNAEREKNTKADQSHTESKTRPGDHD